MSKKFPQKIQKAINEGKLIPFDEIMRQHSQEEREAILERARYLRMAMQLRDLRKKKELSQAQLARKMHVKREFVSRIESGTQNITLNTLYRIGAVVGKEVEVRFT